MKLKTIIAMKKLISLFMMLLMPLMASADAIEIEGIRYSLDAEKKTAEVISKSGGYSGDIIIPAVITHNNIEYKVTSIGEDSFYACSDLTSVVIPEGVTKIKRAAFCDCTGLTSVSLPNSVTSISSNVFCSCKGLISITLPNSLTSIGHYAFQDCINLSSIVIPDKVEYVGEAAFLNCHNLSSVTIPKSMKFIDNVAFHGCENLIVQISDLNAWCNIDFIDSFRDHRLFLNGEELTELTIPEGITTIKKSAFLYCSSLTNVIIPEGVISIEGGAFSSCTNLKSVTIPSSVKSIGNNSFSTCLSLSNLIIPSGVTSIGAGAFRYCNRLTSVTIPKSVDTVEPYAFGACNQLTNIDVASGNESYASESGILYSKDKTEIICYPAGIADKTYTIPNYVTTIGEYAFNGCEKLNEIILPENVTEVKKGAFSGCRGLPSITIPNSVKKIGDSVLEVCDNLTSVKLPDGLSMIPSGLLYGCTSLTSFAIPDGVTQIGGRAFGMCTGLTSISIPNSVTKIDSGAFHNCTGLTSIFLPNNLTFIGDYSFGNCTGLLSVTIPDKVTTIDNSAFYGCYNMTSVSILSSDVEIKSLAFMYCNKLSTVICYSEQVPQTNNLAFLDIESNITLYVPAGSVDAYKAAEPWNKFKEILAVEGIDLSEFSDDVIKITDAGQSTWCSKYDLDFSGVEGLKAYTATGYDRISGTIWLTRVYQVPANEGIFLMGKAGEYHVPHKSTGTYYANLMVGTLQPITLKETDGEYTNYYLSNGDSGVGFYKVNGSVDLKANRAYLPLLKGTTQAGTRFIGIGFEDDGTTNLTPALSEGEREWYTLQGQRVAKPGKGLYIRNGKKVVIK